MILNYDESKAGHRKSYYEERNIFLDCRGDLYIDPTAQFGFECFICSASHRSNWLIGGVDESMQVRRVVIEKNVWVTSRAIVYNSWVREGSIVGIGAVLSGVEVPEFSTVEGSPAVITAVMRDGAWQRLETPIPLRRIDWPKKVDAP